MFGTSVALSTSTGVLTSLSLARIVAPEGRRPNRVAQWRGIRVEIAYRAPGSITDIWSTTLSRTRMEPSTRLRSLPVRRGSRASRKDHPRLIDDLQPPDAVGRTSSLVVRGDRHIGAYATSESLPAARRVFGEPRRLTDSAGYARRCTASWRNGLRLVFRGAGCSSRSVLVLAIVNGSWVTQRGLYAGDPESRLHAPYPSAQLVSRTRTASHWAILRRGESPPSLIVTVRGGVVASLSLRPRVSVAWSG